MESNRKFEIVLNKDIRRFKGELDQYLDDKLKEDKVFCFDTKSLGIEEHYKDDVETKVYFKKPNNESIYYACVNTNDYDYIYVMGLANDPIILTSTWKDEGTIIKPRAAFILNTKDSKKSNLIFAKDCQSKEIFLLLKVNCSDLSDKEIAFIEAKNHTLINEDNKLIINFGSICRKDHALLDNLWNFISNVTIGPSSGEYVRLLNVKIPGDFKYESPSKIYQKAYDKAIINRETMRVLLNKDILDYHETFDGKHRYCMLCGNLIEDSYENKHELLDLVGENPKKCSHCVEEILMSYFQSRVSAPYTNKSHLLSDFEDKNVAVFYLDLLQENGVIDKGHKFKYIKPLESKSIFFEEIPEEYHLETIPEQENIIYSNIGKLISILDKETITGNFELLPGFKNRLSKNQLAEEDGWAIRDIMIELIKDGHISDTKKVSKKLKNIIKDFDNLGGIDLRIYESVDSEDHEVKSSVENFTIKGSKIKDENTIDLRKTNRVGRILSFNYDSRPLIYQEGK